MKYLNKLGLSCAKLRDVQLGMKLCLNKINFCLIGVKYGKVFKQAGAELCQAQLNYAS